MSQPAFKLSRKELASSFESYITTYFENVEKTKKPDLVEDENLGQVFTSPELARFMVSLIEDNIKLESKILDPCIGPNTFFKAFSKHGRKANLTGIEIDRSLIDREVMSFFNNKSRELINGSFFDLSINKKYDFIIQNPPYVRQELLTSGVNSKAKTSFNISQSFKIPSQSNLYVYFLLKSIAHLKENGTLIAVIYDSWLYSTFGDFLKRSFLNLGHLESIYHFKKNAFDAAEVGATVIKFIKNSGSKEPVSYYSFERIRDLDGNRNAGGIKLRQSNLLSYSFNNKSQIKWDNSLFLSLKDISMKPIQRGTSAIINKYFVFQEKKYPELKPIIKNVSKIKTYKVQEPNAYILSIDKNLSEQTKVYLDKIRSEILSLPEQKYKAVKRSIKSGKNWFKIKLKNRGNFIFNYYLRNNIDFIYNPERKLSSDNFYAINIDENELANVSILNSTFSKLSVLNNSRSQGQGLRKIQLYEFEDVKVIDIKKLSRNTIDKLSKLGEELVDMERYNQSKSQLIDSIDRILIREYNAQTNSKLNMRELKQELKEYYS